jgi:hypothetical protein
MEYGESRFYGKSDGHSDHCCKCSGRRHCRIQRCMYLSTMKLNVIEKSMVAVLLESNEHEATHNNNL